MKTADSPGFTPWKNLDLRYAVLIATLICFMWILWPFAYDLILAAIFAFGLYQPMLKLNRAIDRRLPRPLSFLHGWGSLIILSVVMFLATALLIFALLQIYEELRELSEGRGNALLDQLSKDGTRLWQDFQNSSNEMLNSLGVGSEQLRSQGIQVVENAGRAILAFLGRAVSMIPEFSLHFMVFIALLVLFLRKGPAIRRYLIRSPLFASDVDQLVHILQRSSYIVVSSNLLIGAIQAGIVTFGSVITGYSNWAVVFVITYVGTMIPVIGAAPTAFVLAAISYVSGDHGKAVLLLVIMAFTAIIDNILRALLVSRGDIYIHPLISLVGLIGAVVVFGFPGLFIGPFAMTVSVGLFNTIFSDHDSAGAKHKRSP